LIEYHPEAIAEIDASVLSEKGVKILLYTAKPVEFRGIEVISTEENIYGFFVQLPPLIEARSLSNEASIPRAAFFMAI